MVYTGRSTAGRQIHQMLFLVAGTAAVVGTDAAQGDGRWKTGDKMSDQCMKRDRDLSLVQSSQAGAPSRTAGVSKDWRTRADSKLIIKRDSPQRIWCQRHKRSQSAFQVDQGKVQMCLRC